MDNETIKKKIFALRQAQGLSWADLAQKTGQKSYRNIVNALNSQGLTLRTLERLAKALDCKPWQLLQEDNETNNPEPIAPRIICPHCGKNIYLCTSPEPRQIGPAKTKEPAQDAMTENNQHETPSSDKAPKIAPLGSLFDEI